MSNPHASRPVVRGNRHRGSHQAAQPGPSTAVDVHELDALPRRSVSGASAPQLDFLEANVNHERSPGGATSVATAKNFAQRAPAGLPARAVLSYVRPHQHLGSLATSAMIVNRVVGSGIFDLSPTLLLVVGSKGAAMVAWLLGCLVTWAGMIVYLEYGIQFPLTGAELYYIDFVWVKPAALVTYMYAIMFTCLSGSQGNALAFGSAVQVAATAGKPVVNYGLQKLLAVALVGLVCLCQAYSRGFSVGLSTFVGVFKILLLTFISVGGWVALSGQRTAAAKAAFPGPYGKENFANAFEGTSSDMFNWGVALLITQRAFLGYENANLIREEIRTPSGDRSRIFRRSAKISISMLCGLYVLVNVAFFAACTGDELRNTSDVAATFFEKLFGQPRNARLASGILRATSAAGEVIAFSYSSVKVKQEIARLGILPYPEFWARSSHGGTPGPALLLHFFFTSLFIVCTPLASPNGYIIISTLFTWTRSWVGFLLGLGLLGARICPAFRNRHESWTPKSMPSLPSRIQFGLVFSFALIYTLANGLVFGLCWAPKNFKGNVGSKPILPPYTGPVAGTAISFLGAVYWVWDRWFLPRIDYIMKPEVERVEDYTVHIQFTRYVNGFALEVIVSLMKFWTWLREALPQRRRKDRFEAEPLTHSYSVLGSDDAQRVVFG